MAITIQTIRGMRYVQGTYDELLEYALPQIRPQSLEFYEPTIKRELAEDGTTLIDRHAIGAITRLLLGEWEVLTEREYAAKPADYRSTWATERTDIPNWSEIRHQYMGQRTLLTGRGLLIEGRGLHIVNGG